MLVCCCRVLLVLCVLFWRGGRVFPFLFRSSFFVCLCFFLSSLVGACACAPLLCLYSQGYFCSPLTPAKKSHFGQVGFASHALPDAGLLRLLACDCRRLIWRRRPRRGLAGWLWSVAAGPDCSTHPPPWRLRHLFPRIRIYHFVACFFSYGILSRTCSLPCLPPPVFFSSCPVCCGIFAALMGASLGSLDVCVVGEVFNAAGLVARFPPL